MSTAVQQPTFFDDDDYGLFMEEAKRRYPHSAKHGQLRGAGRYVLLSKCPKIWHVFLFANSQQRADALDRFGWSGCGAVRCTHAHYLEKL